MPYLFCSQLKLLNAFANTLMVTVVLLYPEDIPISEGVSWF